MDFIMFIVGFFLIIVSIISLIVLAIKKQPKKKAGITLLIGLVLMITGVTIPGSENKDNVSSEKSTITQKEKDNLEEANNKEHKESTNEKLELDKLQQLYLNFDDSITRDDIINAINENNLFYSEKEYSNGPTIKIAYKKEVSYLSHAESGDYIEISFNKDLEVEHIEYFNNDKFLSLIDYRKGTYWSFRDQPEYKGYYINGYNNKLGSFKVKYDNGNETEVEYLKVDSKEEQINFLFKYNQ